MLFCQLPQLVLFASNAMLDRLLLMPLNRPIWLSLLVGLVCSIQACAIDTFLYVPSSPYNVTVCLCQSMTLHSLHSDPVFGSSLSPCYVYLVKWHSLSSSSFASAVGMNSPWNATRSAWCKRDSIAPASQNRTMVCSARAPCTRASLSCIGGFWGTIGNALGWRDIGDCNACTMLRWV